MRKAFRLTAAGIVVSTFTVIAAVLFRTAPPAALGQAPRAATQPAGTFDISDLRDAGGDLRDLGLNKRSCTVNVPGDHMITETCRTYRDGKFDPKLSYRHVSIPGDAKPYQYICELGYVDPNATSPTHVDKVRLLIPNPDSWVDVPKSPPDEVACNGIYIGGVTPMAVGRNHVFGHVLIHEILDITRDEHGRAIQSPRMDSDGCEAAAVKMTLTIRVDPMTEKDFVYRTDGDGKRYRIPQHNHLPVGD